MRILLAIALVAILQPVIAEDGEHYGDWTFDSNWPATQAATAHTDAQELYGVINQMVALWNAHDIEHYMDFFWKSDNLLVVSDGEQILGWNNLLATYQRSYPNRQNMAICSLERVKIQSLDADLSLVLSWWTVRCGSHNSYSTDTAIFRKFADGWKVVADHATFLAP
jgi:ketosteroid isomerase-like protein